MEGQPETAPVESSAPSDVDANDAEVDAAARGGVVSQWDLAELTARVALEEQGGALLSRRSNHTEVLQDFLWEGELGSSAQPLPGARGVGEEARCDVRASISAQKRVLTACRKVLRQRYLGRKRVTAAFFNHVREEMSGACPEAADALMREYIVTATGLQCSRCFLGLATDSVEGLPFAELLALAQRSTRGAATRLGCAAPGDATPTILSDGEERGTSKQSGHVAR